MVCNWRQQRRDLNPKVLIPQHVPLTVLEKSLHMCKVFLITNAEMKLLDYTCEHGLPRWHYLKEPTCQCRRCKRHAGGSLGDVRDMQEDPWVGKITWRRSWQPTPVFLPEKSYGPRSLVGFSPWGPKELDTTEWLSSHVRQLYLSRTERRFFFPYWLLQNIEL